MKKCIIVIIAVLFSFLSVNMLLPPRYLDTEG